MKLPPRQPVPVACTAFYRRAKGASVTCDRSTGHEGNHAGENERWPAGRVTFTPAQVGSWTCLGYRMDERRS